MTDHDADGVTIDVQKYRDVMATYPAGVTVITTRDDDGNAFGMTVSAFTSVSIDPPLILIVIDKQSHTLPHLRASGAFTVNMLAAGTSDVALGFAAPSGDKFVHVDRSAVRAGTTGPILGAEAIGFLECRIVQEVESGDHWILVARVQGGAVLDDRAPLVYCNRTFNTVASRVAPAD